MPTAFLCDFDGTIAPHDIGADFVLHFAGARVAEVEPMVARWRAGEIGSRELTLAECRLLAVNEEDALAFVRGYRIDPDFGRFARDVRERGDSVMVVSEGFDFYVRDLLARAGLGDLPWSANGSRFVAGGFTPEFPRAATGCGRCGNCKGQHVKDHRAQGYEVVLVGDGFSDRCGARAADRVLARGHLLAWCRREGIAATPFENFAEVATITRDFARSGDRGRGTER